MGASSRPRGLGPKPIQKPHVPIMVGGYADAGFAKEGRKRSPDYRIIITPPMSMTTDAMQDYADFDVHRPVLNLGSQKPKRVDQRLAEIASPVKKVA